MDNYSQPGGQQTVTVVVTDRPDDHLTLAVFTCLCCFWPTGIAAIVFACMSQSASDRMDYVTAKKQGNLAKIFSLVSLSIGLLGIVGAIIYCVVVFVVFANAMNSIATSG